MSQREEILLVEPHKELKFRGPFSTKTVFSYIKLTNTTDRRVLFKIKATVPSKYCVRPCSGILKAKGLKGIAVFFMPFRDSPIEEISHKFMVQSMIAPEGNFDPEVVWREADPNDVMHSKLNCVFEMPGNQTPSHHVCSGKSYPELYKEEQLYVEDYNDDDDDDDDDGGGDDEEDEDDETNV